MAAPRGSIFGALLLISIGGLFLWANLDPSLRPWYLIGRYWPVLIIFWGLGKLVDYLSARGTPEAAQAARLSGGDIFLLIFILLIGTAVSRATQRSFWGDIGVQMEDEDWERWFGNRYEFSAAIEQALPSPAILHITNQGNVTLIAQDGAGLQGTVRKIIYAPTEAEAEQRAQEVEVGLEPIPGGPAGSYQLRLKLRGGDARGARADLELRVPIRTSVRLESRRGDARIEGLTGEVQVDLDRGSAEIASITGPVKVELRRGSARVEHVRGNVEVRGRGNEIAVADVQGEARIEGEFVGPIRASAISQEAQFVSRRTNFTAERIDGELELVRGDLNVRRPAGNITLIAEDKDIDLDDLEGAVRVQNRHGLIKLRFPRSPRQPIEAESHSGDIEVVLPANSAFSIEARAPSGEIINQFSGDQLTLKEENGGATLTGSYGQRGPGIRLTSRYGSIRLLRATPAGAGQPPSR